MRISIMLGCVVLMLAQKALACLPQTRFMGDACPVDLSHIEKIKAYYDCETSKASESRRAARLGERVETDCRASSGGSEDPMMLAGAFIIPAAVLAKMSPAQRRQAIDRFFTSQRDSLVSGLARRSFEEEFQSGPKPEFPTWAGDLNEEQVKGLSSRERARRSSPQHLYNLHRQLKQDRTDIGRQRLLAFENQYQRYILSSRGQPWTSIKREPRIQMISPLNGESSFVDLANDDFDSIPNNVAVDRNGSRSSAKALHQSLASRQVDSARAHFLRGGTLNNLQFTGASREQLETFKKVVIKAGAEHRATLSEPPSLSGANRNRKIFSQSNRGMGRVLRFGGLPLALASLIVSVHGIEVEAQARCDQAYPFFPTNHRSGEVHGLPLSSRCEWEIPLDGAPPQPIKDFLAMSPQDQMELLQLSSTGKSPCNYYRLVYNRLFCPSEQIPEDSVTPASQQ